MKFPYAIRLFIASLLLQVGPVTGAETAIFRPAAPSPGAATAPAPATPRPAVPAPTPAVAAPLPVSSAYILSPNDVVQMKVYQEDDMETKVRIGKDGTASFPLIGAVQIGGRSVEQAAAVVSQMLDRDYLVNPQVTLSVVEYSKRRFTVLGQVQKPGTFEIPSEESATLLQAIAMAGGYTRLANPGKVTITRVHGGQKMSYTLDARSLASDANAKAFDVQADDTITVHERFF